jgi:hypothetical protein
MDNDTNKNEYSLEEYQAALRIKVDEVASKIPDLPKGVGEIVQTEITVRHNLSSGCLLAYIERTYCIPFNMTVGDIKQLSHK